ncbi:hypothetical protein EDB19DRAFT_1988135 [Suillus lakei]|nr:hypothetical protein EDB19DRAFT_1988135 [Suillus lakei]
MAYPYPFAFPDARQFAHASSHSTLSGLEPAPAQSMYYPGRPNATPDDGIPISEYLRAQTPTTPDLSGALGPAPAPGQTHQYVRLQAPVYAGASISPYSAVPHTLSGSHEGSSSARSVYPYPERNVLHPAKYTANMPPVAQQKIYKTVIPSGYHQLPQPSGIEKCAQPSSWTRIGSQHAAIKFNRRGGGKPFRIGELIELDDRPEVEGGHDQVFNGIAEMYIKVLITWPGYSQFPLERRIYTDSGTLTRVKLLKMLVRHIEEFMHHVHRQDIAVEREYEEYELVWRARGLPSIWRDCLITSLVHKSGSTWHVDLYMRA